MNRNKLTPCRKVGLSRKKNTPLKTVEGLLKKENIVKQTLGTSDLQSSKRTASPNPIPKSDVSNDTPCRQVGLSRKRKTSTPVGNFKINEGLCTPSLPNNRINKRKSCKENNDNNHTSPQLLEKIQEKNDEIVKNSESNEEIHVSCAKKLSNLFFSPQAKTKQNGAECLPDSQCSGEKKIILSETEKDSHAENFFLESASDNITLKEKNESSRESSNSTKDKISEQNKILVENNNEELNQTNHCDKNENDSILAEEVSSEIIIRNSQDSNILSQNNSQFIKVNYSKQNKLENKVLKQKQTKIACELFDNDDDFEIGPKQKKIKKDFERSKTDIIKKEKKSNKNKLKKSLSVGDPTLRTLTDSPITSSTCTLNSLNVCFVKLEQMKESTELQNLRLTPQDQSDDDFETFTCTPKEIKIKNLDSLEKEVEEKRQILEELKRAKLHKKMHSIEELKKLSEKWKTGCVDALQDLLKQLNTHSQMTMGMLLTKLNIPEDFIPLSQ